MKIKSEENKVHQYRRYRIIILPLSLSKGPPLLQTSFLYIYNLYNKNRIFCNCCNEKCGKIN